jgi:hypothetical protein
MSQNAKYVGNYCVKFHSLTVKYFLTSPCTSLSFQNEGKETCKAKVCIQALEIQYKHLSWLTTFVIKGVGMADFYKYQGVKIV